MTHVDNLLRRPMYVFDLPENILSSIQLKHKASQTAELQNDASSEKKEIVVAVGEDAKTGTASCALCGIRFKDVADQRVHVKSDFHRYNLKQKVKGVRSVSETEFDTLVGDLDESISGSETSESGEEVDEDAINSTKSKDDLLTALLKKQARISPPANSSDTGSPIKLKAGSGNYPLYWFTSPSLAANVSLGIYRALFTHEEREHESQVLDIIRKKQLRQRPALQNSGNKEKDALAKALLETPHFFLCMIGGGHFAAMIVSLVPKLGKNATGAEERKPNVLAHKTFHRYTTRRKQGGAQSSNDASKGAAHSAGSSLRRYNEAALTAEVRDLLNEWRSMIDSAQLLFIRATGSTSRRALYGPYERQVLQSNDPRIRGFPFTTRRATQTELTRAFVELTRVKVSEVDEAALKASTPEAEQNLLASITSQRNDKSISLPETKVSEEEAAALLHTSQIQALIRRSKGPAVISYISSHSIPPDFIFQPTNTKQNHHAPTPLHLAASTNSPMVVHALLTRAKANPTTMNAEGKPAFALAGDRATRDAFRVARHELGEETWDWAVALVPPALSKADADKREERDRREAETREEERRKAELERLKLEGAKIDASQQQQRKGDSGVGRALGTVDKTGAEKREEEGRGLTAEMRMKLERERRARAAEDRIKRMQGRGVS